MTIRDWPAEDRPREKLIIRGAGALSDAELLAIFLRTGVSGISAVQLAQRLLMDFGGLRALLAADREAFCAGHGLGPAKYVQLQAVLEMAARHLDGELRSAPVRLEAPDAALRFLRSRLQHRQYEVFACLHLDTRHQVIAFEELSSGTIDAAAVYPREIVRAVIQHNAAAVILCHNHPSGVAEPSRADEHITRRLVEALATIDVRVLDHIIIGDGQTTSFAERGLL